MSTAAWMYEKEAAAVEEAASNAMNLIRTFGEMDPRAGDEITSNKEDANPWRNPEQILAELDEARNVLTAAWDKLKERVEKDRAEASDDDNQKVVVNPEDFRASYMNLVTDAFSDVLEDLRNGKEEINVDVLVDCLQSGLDLFSQDDKELFMQELDVSNNSSSGAGEADEEEMDNAEDSKLTPHERRRRQLGFHVETAV